MCLLLLVCIFASVVVLTSGCSITVPASKKPAGPDRLLISYKGRIYSINEDGTSVVNLSGDPGKVTENYPRWSPDRKTIAYIRYMEKHWESDEGEPLGRTTNAEIWLMDASGDNKTKLADLLNM